MLPEDRRAVLISQLRAAKEAVAADWQPQTVEFEGKVAAKVSAETVKSDSQGATRDAAVFVKLSAYGYEIVGRGWNT